MIITIDGLDGVGKSTLAKKLAKELGYEYVDKPIYELFNVKSDDNYLYNEIKHIQELVYEKTNSNVLKSYFTGLSLLYIKECVKDKNLVIDRGLLSAYTFNGDDSSNIIYETLIALGVFFDLSIFLTASNDIRLERLRKRKDKNLDILNNKIINLNHNSTISFINDHSELPCYIIDTDGKGENEVFIEALDIIKSKLKQKTLSYRKKD